LTPSKWCKSRAKKSKYWGWYNTSSIGAVISSGRWACCPHSEWRALPWRFLTVVICLQRKWTKTTSIFCQRLPNYWVTKTVSLTICQSHHWSIWRRQNCYQAFRKRSVCLLHATDKYVEHSKLWMMLRWRERRSKKTGTMTSTLEK